MINANVKKAAINFGLLLLAVVGFGFFYVAKTQALFSLEPYCSGAHFNIPTEDPSCHRASDECGVSYESTKNVPYDYNRCLGNGIAERSTKVCAGYVPLCCYEVERTGIPTKCPWPEDEYCHPQQCAKIKPELRNSCYDGRNHKCYCGNALNHWCIQTDGLPSVPYIPLETRFGMQPPAPTDTPSAAPSPTSVTQPTPTPQPTATPQPTRPLYPTTAITPTSYQIPTSAVVKPTIRNNIYPTSLPPPTIGPITTSNQSSPSIINLPNFQLIANNTKAQLQIAAIKTAFASQRVLDLPRYIVAALLSLDRQLEQKLNQLHFLSY